MKKVLIGILFSSILLACNKTTENDSVNKPIEETATNESAEASETVAPKEEVKKENANPRLQGKIVINKMYATSTALPQSENTVYNCFDGNLKTSWKTIKGSTHEEGIMIYLDSPTSIYRIEALDNDGKRIRGIDIYADGGNHWEGMEKPISNIFIKKSNNFRYTGNSYKYQPDESFEIAEIEFIKDNEEKYDVVTPVKVNGKVTASSHLSPDVAYGPNNLIDKIKENGWAENVNDNGIGETFTISTDKEITADEIRIWNGYQRSKEHLAANAAIKKLTIKTPDGYSKTVTLSKTNDNQSVTLDTPLSGKSFTFTINEAFGGTKYKDLVVSEIQFLKDGIAYDINSKEEVRRVKNNKAVDNKLLQYVLDRNLYHNNYSNSKEGSISHFQSTSISLLLRSNNTFVLYDSEVEGFYDESDEMEYGYEPQYDKNSEIIGDGSWEIKSLEDDKVIVRIFGKKFEPRDQSDIYKGEIENSTLKIFQDQITITPNYVVGKNVLGKIPFNE